MMLIDDLPNDCLYLIFQWIHDLQDLLRCYQVNKHWHQVIIHRLRRVKYLQFADRTDNKIDDDTINYNCQHDIYRIDKFDLDDLLPNLRIVEISNSKTGCLLDTFNYRRLLAKVRYKVQGLIFPMQFDSSIDDMIECCENVQMVASHCLGWRSKKMMFGRRMRQLAFNYDSLSYIADRIRYFPNLIRLHLKYHNDRLRLKPDSPVLGSLEIIELSSVKPFIDTTGYHGFRFMDWCPSLKSAYHALECNRGVVDVTQTNENLEDLVIIYRFNTGQPWESLEKLLKNYPNLKHLAIRRNTLLRDEHVVKVISILPQLMLFDVRGSKGITCIANENVNRFCRLHNRTVKFYYEPGNERILKDWPYLSIQNRSVCKGFDFMRHCFLKTFEKLPLILDDY